MQTRHQHFTTDQAGDPVGATTTHETALPRSAGPRRLQRSRDDRTLGGVCGGIAEHFGIDPVIVRVTTVALVFAGGVGVAPYVAAWVLMPLDGKPAATITGRAPGTRLSAA